MTKGMLKIPNILLQCRIMINTHFYIEKLMHLLKKKSFVHTYSLSDMYSANAGANAQLSGNGESNNVFSSSRLS